LGDDISFFLEADHVTILIR